MLNVMINTEYGEYLETATANIKDYIREGAITFNITIFSINKPSIMTLSVSIKM